MKRFTGLRVGILTVIPSSGMKDETTIKTIENIKIISNIIFSYYIPRRDNQLSWCSSLVSNDPSELSIPYNFISD
jgi:hypothetical protein